MLEEKIWKGVDLVLEAFKESPEYATYQKARTALKTQPEKIAKINDFREAKYRLQNGDINGPGVELEALFAKQQVLYEDIECREYLVTEAKLCNMVRKVAERVMEIMDLEIPVVQKGEDADGCQKD